MGTAGLVTEASGEFAAALPDGGVLLGLDLGTRTIGTAFCDAGWSFASADMMRSASTPPQPASCRRQKAWFLFAKNGVGRRFSIAMTGRP